MAKTKKFKLFVFSGCVVALFVGYLAMVQYDKKTNIGPAPSPEYESACGSCHMAYPPNLLPAASWQKLVPDNGEHFGDTLELDADELQAVQAYLEANAADRSSTWLGRTIMKSLGGASPELVSEVPYIVYEHRKIEAEVFQRPAVGGLGNCISCHPGAQLGDFDDDDVIIPQ